MGCAAEVIALDDVRASHQRQALRHQLHARFDQWLDEVEAQLPDAEPTFAQVTETIWALRQSLTAGVAQTIVESSHHEEQRRASLRCAACMRLLGTHLRRDTPAPQWFQASGAISSSDGHSRHFGVTNVEFQLSRVKRIPRLLKARPAGPRLVQTLIGEIEVQRPYCYCRHCHHGRYPLDERLGLSAGRMQRDRRQAAVDVATA